MWMRKCRVRKPAAASMEDERAAWTVGGRRNVLYETRPLRTGCSSVDVGGWDVEIATFVRVRGYGIAWNENGREEGRSSNGLGRCDYLWFYRNKEDVFTAADSHSDPDFDRHHSSPPVLLVLLMLHGMSWVVDRRMGGWELDAPARHCTRRGAGKVSCP